MTASVSSSSFTRKSQKNNRWDIVCLIILACFALTFLWNILFLDDVLMPFDLHQKKEPWRSEISNGRSGGTFWNKVPSDALWQFYPMASYSQEAWAQGPPLWDPYLLSGMPALARGELFTNPVFVGLSSFFSIDTALNLNALLSLLIASLSMFLLLREMKISRFGAMIGSLAFSYSSYLVCWLSLPVTTASMVWLPLILFSYERSMRRRQWRWTLIGIFAFSLQILSGHVLWSFYSACGFCLFVGLRTVEISRGKDDKRGWKRSLVTAALILLFGAILVAPHIFQTLELYSQTGRSRAIGATSALPLKNLIRLLAPDFWGNPLSGNVYWGKFNYTETALYFGVIPLIFIVISLFSRRKLLARGIFAIGFVCLLAVYGIPPFRQFVALVVPVFLKTFPGRIFYLTTFFWTISAAIGADWIESQQSNRKTRNISFFTAGLAAVLLLLAGAIVIFHRATEPATSRLLADSLKVEELRIQSTLTGVCWLTISALILWLWRRKEFRPALKIGIIVVVVTDLFFTGIHYNPSFPKELAYPSTPSLNFLQELQQKEPEPFRVLNVPSRLVLPGQALEYYRLQTASGYSSWLLQRYSDYADLSDCRASGLGLQVYFRDCCNPLLDALNIRYIISDDETILRGTGSFALLTVLPEARIDRGSAGSVQKRTWTINHSRRKVLLQLPSSRIEFHHLPIRRLTRLKTAIAMGPKSWNREGDGVLFRILADAGEPELLFSKYIDPKHKPDDRRWFQIDLDLGRFEGKDMSLIFLTDPGPDQDPAFDWAGWAEPRLIGAVDPKLSLVFDGGNRIYRNTKALPRAWIVYKVTEINASERKAVIEFLKRPGFDPAKEAVIEGRLPHALRKEPPENLKPSVKIRSYEAERVVLTTRTERDGLLILSDSWYPGWEVTVDGEKSRIFPTNLIMRGVFLESGRHEVVFKFHPRPFWWGIVFSATVFGLTALAFAVVIIRRKHRPDMYEITGAPDLFEL